ncbi:hypothetical protein PCASD_12001 [Puccinia coronata f. sp. avenae]|uniref:Uncharacterized protein n=1 Tax=Puccinia coronata f. sp. avenae TaxID=200324 RepID=A0A2N5UA86_9BASI|nr:hypothetical protein PCASD_12001 [Puccinia coronata f. sp. avenae]
MGWTLERSPLNALSALCRLRVAWPNGRPWAAQPSPLAAAGSLGRAVFEFFLQKAAQTRQGLGGPMGALPICHP